MGQNYDWLPVTQKDVQFKDVPGTTGAAAVLLYHADYITFVSDYDQSEFVYNRIKVLTDAGRSQADIQIPLAPWVKIHDLQARTINPDGNIYELTSPPYEKVVLKGRGFKFLAETFTFPKVTAGSIIEYKYSLHSKWLYSNHWVLEHDLFTVKEHFLFKHAGPFTMSYVVNGSSAQPVKNNETYELALANVPAFDPEEQMPPTENYRGTVRFFYGRTEKSAVETFWGAQAYDWSGFLNNFVGDHKEIAAAAAAAVGDATDPQEKLRRLYARAQQIRNLLWERPRTEQEEKKEHLKVNKNVADVLKHGYGNDYDITAFFVAMARATGFDASMILVAGRERRFFQRDYLSASQYDSTIAGVALNGKNLLLDPATRFCPFGALRWTNTATSAVKLPKQGWFFFFLPLVDQDRAVVLRVARVTLDEAGSVKGHVTVTFEGGEALERQLLALQTDEAGRTRALEEEVTAWLPPQSSAKMVSSQGWQQTGGPVVADFEIAVPAYAVRTGKRMLVPTTLFPTKQRDIFKNPERKYPIYFPYAFSELDLVVIKMPAGFSAENLPEPTETNLPSATYRTRSKIADGQIITTRGLLIKQILFGPKEYGALKEFFGKAQSGDEFQVVLRQSPPQESH